MKKIISVILVICAIFAFSSCAKQEQAPDGMKNVAPDSEKYYFYVPQSWRTNSGDIVGAYYGLSDRSNVSIMAYGGEFETSEEYWSDFKTRSERVFSAFEVVTENEAKLISERNAIRFVYKMTLDGKDYKCMQTVVSFSNILYVITYTAPAENYDSHLEEVEKILSEFKFK